MALPDAVWDALSIDGEDCLFSRLDLLYKFIKADKKLRNLCSAALPATESLFSLADEDIDGAGTLLRAVCDDLGTAFVTKLFVPAGEEGQRLSAEQVERAFANERAEALTTNERATHVHHGVQDGLPFLGWMPFSSLGMFKGSSRLSFLSLVTQVIAGAL